MCTQLGFVTAATHVCSVPLYDMYVSSSIVFNIILMMGVICTKAGFILAFIPIFRSMLFGTPRSTNEPFSSLFGNAGGERVAMVFETI